MKLTPSTRKKLLIGAAVLLLILIITNPSIKDFKDYIGINTYSGIHREKNLFVCSYFRYDAHNEQYFGIAGNVFKVEMVRANENDGARIDSGTVDSMVVFDRTNPETTNDSLSPFADRPPHESQTEEDKRITERLRKINKEINGTNK